MSVDIAALEHFPVAAVVTKCYFTWTGTTRDTLMPPYQEER